MCSLCASLCNLYSLSLYFEFFYEISARSDASGDPISAASIILYLISDEAGVHETVFDSSFSNYTFVKSDTTSKLTNYSPFYILYTRNYNCLVRNLAICCNSDPEELTIGLKGIFTCLKLKAFVGGRSCCRRRKLTETTT